MSKTSILGIACMLGFGCADTIPDELVDARQAYNRAQAGPAAKHTPAELRMAEVALQKAEATFEGEGDTFKARDRAYIAARKARIAEIHARTLESEQRAAKISSETERLEEGALDRLGSAERALKNQGQELAAERALREEAEKRAEQARADLARIASVGQTERGTVITLPGGVLFASGKSKLLPTAQAKLSQVANALVTGNPDSNMTVEGHTDAQGSEKYNLRLSQERAEAVRTYLVSHGIAADRISAQGLGEASPIADNTSPEGRANNRRVEIVVQNPAKGADAANTDTP
jgi:outer membrane protein OmpA-like peptidoglycan-associated protein